MIRRWLARLSGHHHPPAPEPPFRDAINSQLKQIIERCTDCGACTHHCAFLQQYGSPLTLVQAISPDRTDCLSIAFGCSLCGLCTAVCPQQLDPCNLFLDMRRQRIALGGFRSKPYRPLLVYEAVGCSRLFSWFGLPSACTTVFFPGCALPGTRPEVTLRMFQRLNALIPALGIVLKCCTKPSHDLGFSDDFFANFNAIRNHLLARGITTVITACPNCTKIFRCYAPEISVQNVFTFLADQLEPSGEPFPGQEQQIVIHDPCPMRDDPSSQEASRKLLHALGYIPLPMRHQKKQTLCCGEGGAVGFVHPNFALAWKQKRIKESGGRPIITTCAGCSTMLAHSAQVIHLADLLFPASETETKSPTVACPPMTYINRLWLKFRVWRSMDI